VVRVNSEGKSTLAGPASVEAFEKEHRPYGDAPPRSSHVVAGHAVDCL